MKQTLEDRALQRLWETPPLDELSRSFYEMKLELLYLSKKGNEFQDFFSQLMELRFPGDFLRTRPWGNAGDKKNDGYLRSKWTLYQVYAPNELSAAEAIKKIDEDFSEALPFWKDHFSTWIFVHNSKQGLGPDVTKKLLDLCDGSHQIQTGHFGFPEFRIEAFQLSPADLGTLLGPVPTQRNFSQLGFEKLKTVLLTVAKQAPSLEPEIRPVPKDKLKTNRLSSNVEALLRAGMTKSDLVSEFFRKWTDPTLGDQIAETFTTRYKQLRDAGLPPDVIFMELHRFAAGEERKDPDHEAAVLAVLAHFFEECDIFEGLTSEAVSGGSDDSAN